MAWKEDGSILTVKGREKRDEVFEMVTHRSHQVNNVEETVDYWKCSVTKQGRTGIYTVIVPKTPGTHGSYFGSCTCGSQKVMGLPCEHMAALVRSGELGVLNEDNIMPYWWTKAQLQMQYPQ